MLILAYIVIAVIVALCLAVYAIRSGDDLNEAATVILLSAIFWPIWLAGALFVLTLDFAVTCLIASAIWISRKIDKLQAMAKKNPSNS